jgi:hypothetical protein
LTRWIGTFPSPTRWLSSRQARGSKWLYDSNQAANHRDHFGNGNKFITPVVGGWQGLCRRAHRSGGVWVDAAGVFAQRRGIIFLKWRDFPADLDHRPKSD